MAVDHLAIAGAVLLWIWGDTRRRSWPLARWILLAAAFVALGTPALLGYLPNAISRSSLSWPECQDRVRGRAMA